MASKHGRENWCTVTARVQETGEVSFPTLIHSFVACDRTRLSHAPALHRGSKEKGQSWNELLETEGGTHLVIGFAVSQNPQ